MAAVQPGTLAAGPDVTNKQTYACMLQADLQELEANHLPEFGIKIVKLYQYYFYTTLCHADCSQQ
jgi:hypothetical protein